MQRNYILGDLWRIAKMYHQFGGTLNTFTKGTNSRQKEIPHHFTADAFNDYFLSIAETVVKSQDSPDNDQMYSLLISVSKRQREPVRLPYP